MRTTLLSLIYVSIAFFVYGQSGSNPKSEELKPKTALEAADSKKPSSGILDRGTEPKPLIVRLENTPELKIDPTTLAPSSPENASVWGSVADWCTVGVAVFALIVATVQLLFFTRQLRNMDDTLTATKRSVVEMQASDERQLRAYISITLQSEDAHPNIDQSYCFRFNCINHGRTPGLKLKYRATMSFFSQPYPEKFKLPEFDNYWNEERMSLFPYIENRSIETKMGCNFRKKLPPDDIEKFYLGKGGIAIGIELEYLDVFASDKWHKTLAYYLVTKDKVATIPGSSEVS